MTKNRHKFIIILLLFLGFLPSLLQAQGKNVTTQTLYWLKYNPVIDFGNNWSLGGEFELRRYAFPHRHHQLLIPGITVLKKVSNRFTVGAGISYIRKALPQIPEEEIELIRSEIRLSQQATLKNKWGSTVISHRYILEERFKQKTAKNEIVDGYDFNFRFRYRLQFTIPLIQREKATTFALKVYDEIMINVGKEIVQNTFDQNRIYFGVDLMVSPRSSLDVGLMHLFQQRSSGVDFRSRYILRASFSQNF